MKLIYLFVKKWSSRNLSNEHYQLDSNDIFEVQDDVLTYKHEDVLQQSFWSYQTSCRADAVSNASPGKIDSVSAIIGKNGSGKTTFFTALGACFEHDGPEPEYLCVCKKGRIFYVYTNLVNIQYDRVREKLGGDNFKVSSKSEGWSPYEPPFAMLYYSPFSCPYFVWDKLKNNMYDLSMTRLLSEIKLGDSDVVKQLDDLMRRTSFNFARIFAIEQGKHPDSKVPFPVPMYVKIGGTYSARLDGRGLIVGMVRGVANSDVVWDERLFTAMSKMFCLEAIPSFRISVLMDFAGIIIQTVQAEDKSLRSLWENQTWQNFVFEMNGIFDLISKTPVKHDLNYVEEPLRSEWYAMKDNKRQTLFERIRGVGQQLLVLQSDKINTLLVGLFDLWTKIDDLYRLGNVQEADHHIMIPLSSSAAFGSFLSCFECSTSLSLKGDRIQFLIPGMSSGEMTYLYFWGRLYEAFSRQGLVVPIGKDTNKKRKAKHVHAVLLLDEVETAMHPAWQKLFVKSLVWFIETFTRDLSVHVVVSSHSPLLLSDIPKGNIVFLKKEESVQVGGHIEEAHENRKQVCAMANTFAANIFDLYKDSFFLDQGTMGEFAADKVDKLLEKLNPKRKDNETEQDYQKRIKIGDNDLKVAKLIGDPFLSRYIWRRLEELSDNADILEDEFTVSDETKEIIELRKKQDEEKKNKEAKKGGSEQ